MSEGTREQSTPARTQSRRAASAYRARMRAPFKVSGKHSAQASAIKARKGRDLKGLDAKHESATPTLGVTAERSPESLRCVR